MLQELIENLKKYKLEEISYKASVSLGTVSRIISGANTDPKISTVEKLQKFVEQKEGEK